MWCAWLPIRAKTTDARGWGLCLYLSLNLYLRIESRDLLATVLGQVANESVRSYAFAIVLEQDEVESHDIKYYWLTLQEFH